MNPKNAVQIGWIDWLNWGSQVLQIIVCIINFFTPMSTRKVSRRKSYLPFCFGNNGHIISGDFRLSIHDEFHGSTPRIVQARGTAHRTLPAVATQAASVSDYSAQPAILQCINTWWLIPLSKWVITPNSKWTNPTDPIYNWGYNPLTKWDEPPSIDSNPRNLV